MQSHYKKNSVRIIKQLFNFKKCWFAMRSVLVEIHVSVLSFVSRILVSMNVFDCLLGLQAHAWSVLLCCVGWAGGRDEC